MLFRVLLWALAIVMVVRAVARFIQGLAEGAGAGPARRPSPGTTAPLAKGELMARDPVCGTYVVQSRALSVRDGNGVQYFCSDKCRQAFQSR